MTHGMQSGGDEYEDGGCQEELLGVHESSLHGSLNRMASVC